MEFHNGDDDLDGEDHKGDQDSDRGDDGHEHDVDMRKEFDGARRYGFDVGHEA